MVSPHGLTPFPNIQGINMTCFWPGWPMLAWLLKHNKLHFQLPPRYPSTYTMLCCGPAVNDGGRGTKTIWQQHKLSVFVLIISIKYSITILHAMEIATSNASLIAIHKLRTETPLLLLQRSMQASVELCKFSDPTAALCRTLAWQGTDLHTVTYWQKYWVEKEEICFPGL